MLEQNFEQGIASIHGLPSHTNVMHKDTLGFLKVVAANDKTLPPMPPNNFIQKRNGF